MSLRMTWASDRPHLVFDMYIFIAFTSHVYIQANSHTHANEGNLCLLRYLKKIN